MCSASKTAMVGEPVHLSPSDKNNFSCMLIDIEHYYTVLCTCMHIFCAGVWHLPTPCLDCCERARRGEVGGATAVVS